MERGFNHRRCLSSVCSKHWLLTPTEGAAVVVTLIVTYDTTILILQLTDFSWNYLSLITWKLSLTVNNNFHLICPVHFGPSVTVDLIWNLTIPITCSVGCVHVCNMISTNVIFVNTLSKPSVILYWKSIVKLSIIILLLFSIYQFLLLCGK